MRKSRIISLVIVCSLIVTMLLGNVTLISAATTLLFSDDFESGNSNNWSVQSGYDDWSIESENGNYVYYSSSTSEGRTYAGDQSWSDYTVKAKIKVEDFNGSNRALLAGRYQDGNNYYAASLTGNNKLEILRKAGGSTSTIASKTYSLSTGQWYEVQLVMTGSTIQMFVDGELELEVNDNAISSGGIGLVGRKAKVKYDDVLVYAGSASDEPTNPEEPEEPTEPEEPEEPEEPTEPTNPGGNPTDGELVMNTNFTTSYSYMLINKASGKVMDVTDGSVEGEASVIQWENTGITNQLWKIEDIGGGYFHIVNRYSDKLLQPIGRSKEDGADIIQIRNGSSQAHAWSLEHLGNGDFVITNKNSGKIIEVEGGSQNDGGNIIQGTFNGTDNQIWQIAYAISQPVEPDFSLVGFATVGSGTTGGAGGQTVTVSTAEELIDYIGRDEPYIIQVSGTIDLPNNPESNNPSNRMFNVKSNKTIVGINGAHIRYGGFNIRNESNIIIRNIEFSQARDDSINIEEGSTYIWVDHNTFSNGYDGLVDIKRESNYVTVSWNIFKNHNKNSLVGHDNGHTVDQGLLKVTYHHNWFENTEQRNPRVRYGSVHAFNNYYNNIGSYVFGVGVDAQVISENNYIDNANRAMRYYDSSSQPGYLKDTGSIFTDIGHDLEFRESGIDWSPSEYYFYSVDPVLNVRELVTNYAGAGVINPMEAHLVTTMERDKELDEEVLEVENLLFTMVQVSQSGNQVIYNDDFVGATSSNLFSAAYRSLPGDDSKPMYIKTGGTITSNQESITLDGGRFTIGALSGDSTSSDSTPGGALDLSVPYRIKIQVIATGGSSSKKFQVYVDNNTTSQSNSIHGGASKVYQESIGNIDNGEIVIEPDIGTNQSFIQVRTESNVQITIDEITIEYLNGSEPEEPTEPEEPEEPEEPTEPEEPEEPTEPTDPVDPVEPPENEEALFVLVGYATMNGGTTGGEQSINGLEPIIRYAHTGEELEDLLKYKSDAKKYAERGTINKETGEPWVDHPMIIYIDGTITHDNSNSSKIDVKDLENLSIIGVSTRGEFDGIGMTLTRSNNVIIRNLSMHHVRGGSSTAIEVTTESHNIWIDHNEFFSELDVDKNYYDGLVDIKRNAEYITVSWNKFYNHNKTMLLGHTDNEGLKPDKVTYHHNYYFNLNSRVPLIRYAEVHMFNNYFKDIQDTAINARMGAEVRVENNYFDNVGSGNVDPVTGHIKGPIGWHYGSSETGYWHVSGNTYVNCPVSEYESTTYMTIPYNYENVLHSAEVAKDLVLQYAGVGIIN
jgi:pectate lyase